MEHADDRYFERCYATDGDEGKLRHHDFTSDLHCTRSARKGKGRKALGCAFNGCNHLGGGRGVFPSDIVMDAGDVVASRRCKANLHPVSLRKNCSMSSDGTPKTKNQRGLCAIPNRLRPHLVRARRTRHNMGHVIVWEGDAIEDIDTVFNNAVRQAYLGDIRMKLPMLSP